MQDPLTLVFIVLAGIVLFRLYKVLGEREGHESDPYNPFENKGKKQISPLDDAESQIHTHSFEEQNKAKEEKIKKDPILASIYEHDPDFDKKDFLNGASNAYEAIITAYAEGDIVTLKELVDRELFKTFKDAIEERALNGQTMKVTLIGIDRTNITNAKSDGNTESVTVDFVSQMISATFDSAENVVEGDKEDIQTINDIWTFKRDIKSKSPNWVLVNTSG